MTIRDLKGFVEDKILVNNVLISVSDKKGLEEFIPALIQLNPNIQFLSTGGTYNTIKKYLGDNSENNLLQVSEYTGFPEMEGGLVKTLHPKIHAGILGERNNPEHQTYLNETLHNGVYIDLVVVSLYPFEEIVKKIEREEIDNQTGKPYNFESGRGNIDIGGPTMIRGAAKNFPSCAVICDPADYNMILTNMTENNGAIDFNQRLKLAPKVFETMGKYDTAIGAYFRQQIDTNPEGIKALYQFNECA